MKRLSYLGPFRRFYNEKSRIRPVVLVHGGTAEHADETLENTKKGVQIAAYVGYDTLLEKGNALEAVYEAIRILEIHPRYNAPLDSGLIIDKTVELDATIMSGIDLKCGAISRVKNILHPITLARRIMEKTAFKHVAGESAAQYAMELGFTTLGKDGTLVTPNNVKDLKNFESHLSIRCGTLGTVGAVAIDEHGNVAAATVSGGGMGKVTSRIGASPVIGSGICADNSCGAAAFTVEGDCVIGYSAAARALSLIQFEGLTAQEAVERVGNVMKHRFSRNVGAICIDDKGRIGMHYTAQRMSWAYRRDVELHYGIQRDEHEVRIINSF